MLRIARLARVLSYDKYTIRVINSWPSKVSINCFDKRQVGMYKDVNIFHSGDDPDDKAFAQTIAERIRHFALPRLIDVDELERQDAAGQMRPEGFVGVPVYVISPSMLRDSEYRKKLILGTPGRNSPWRWVFYICRGIELDDIRNNFPDLKKLFFDVMVGEQSHLPNLVEELKMYLEYAPKHVSPTQRILQHFKLVIAILMMGLGSLGYFAYYLAILSSLLLYFSLLITGEQSVYELALACHVLFAAGYSLSRFPPLDFWPELGSTWKVREHPKHASPFGSTHPDSECHIGVFREGATKWLNTIHRSQFWLIFRLCLFIIPGMASLQGSNMIMAGIAVILIGLFIPLLWSQALKHIQKLAYREEGMSASEMERTARFFSQGPQIIHRRLLQAPVRVFISHAWRDDEFTPAAESLYQIVTDLGLPCFLDKRRIPGKFTSWRSQVTDEVLESTHFFVVLGRSASNAQGVYEEVRTTLQRWFTDLEPAIICIVDPEVAMELDKQNISREINFLLHECPKLTYAEASNPEVVAHIIRQRHRQGLLGDWVTLASPFKTLKRVLHDEVISTNRFSV